MYISAYSFTITGYIAIAVILAIVVQTIFDIERYTRRD